MTGSWRTGRVATRVLAPVCVSLLLACGRSARNDSDDSARGGEAGDPAPGGTGGSAGRGGSPARGGSAGLGGSTGLGGEGNAAGDPGCTTGDPPEAPLKRLTRAEYDNTVRELFGNDAEPADSLPPEAASEETLPPTAALVEGYHRLAHEFALRVTRNAATTAAFIGCEPANDEAGCSRRFLSTFLERAFRRPATTDDLEAFATVFANGQTLGGNFQSGVRAVLEVALQSPEFLYRPELGVPAADKGPGWARPTSYEMASRLSYLFWDAPPDDELLEAARGDALRSTEEVERQTRRLLADERAGEPIGSFYLRLLRLRGTAFPAVGEEAHPSFTPQIAELLPEETKAFTAGITLSGEGDFSTLLTAPFTFVNGPLAAYYGIPGVSGAEFRRVDVDPNERGGLLTQASFLASTASGPLHNPVRRGHFVATALLCVTILPDPPDLIPPVEPPDPSATTRELYETLTASSDCAPCHAIMNPLGFAFEHYDAAGLFRDLDNEKPVDATGTLAVTDAAGRFDGALELSRLLAASEDARRCFVRNWFSHTHARPVTSNDACALETLERAFASADENLLELLVALTQNEAFLYLPEVGP